MGQVIWKARACEASPVSYVSARARSSAPDREQLAATPLQLGGKDVSGRDETVLRLRRLREKLGEAAVWLETVRGQGYRLVDA